VPSGRRASGLYNICVIEWFNDVVDELSASVLSNDDDDEWCWWIGDSTWFVWLSIRDMFVDWTLDNSWLSSSSSWKTGVSNSWVVSLGVDVIGIIDNDGKIREGLGYK
jgi:hypothetical protein